MVAPKSQRVRSHTFRVWKNGKIVSARFEGMEVFHSPKVNTRIDRRRVFAVDTESLSLRGKLSTVLIPLRFDTWGELLETPSGLGMLEKFLDHIVDQYGETGGRENQYLSPSKTKQRPKAPRRAKRGRADGRDGRRQKIEPCLAVFFNLPYDFGRLSADRRDILRAANAGADSYRIPISDRLELEVVSMHFGSGSSFEWIVRRDPLNARKRKIARIIGLDLAAYWKTSLAEAAKSVGATDKISIDPELYTKPREAFTRKEWADFRRYALGDAETTLELYHATVDLLVQIDARVIRRTGVIPPSAPGASARIVFAKAFDRAEYTEDGVVHGEELGCHPGKLTWERYSALADQMGLDAYYGGRSFNVERGIRRGMMVADLKSAYPFALACMPDPVTVRAVPVISATERRTGRDANGKPVSYTALQIYEAREKEDWDNEVPIVVGSFELDRWRGQFGVLYIDGESLDDLYPPFRIHSARKMDAGRLRYVAGPFQNRAVTIPEIVVGVVSGRLRVDRIRKGVVFKGSAENSFLRAGILDFFRIKEDVRLPKPLRDMAKLLAVSLYGKLIEIQTTDYGLGSAFPMARFAKAQKVRNAMARINAENGPPLDQLAGIFWGESKRQQRVARTYYDRCQRQLGDSDDRASLAVIDYVTALRRAGMRRETSLDGTENESPIAISDFIGKRYRCGFYFFPLIAANATGLISAMLGLMARELGASQGDTDSVHFVPKETVLLPDAASLLPESYYETMRIAGYLSPRRVGGAGAGHYVDGIPGAPQLGCWEIQTPEASVESVLVRPKVYSHLFPDGTLKQAGHGFARFGATHADLGSAFDQLARVLRNVNAGTMPEARAGQRSLEAFAGAAGAEDLVAAAEGSLEGRRRALHEAFKALVTTGHVTYQGRASPRKLKEAMVSGREIGEFNSRVFEAALTEDPNTFRDPEGRTRWKQAVTVEHVAMKDPVRPVFRKVRRSA